MRQIPIASGRVLTRKDARSLAHGDVEGEVRLDGYVNAAARLVSGSVAGEIGLRLLPQLLPSRLSGLITIVDADGGEDHEGDPKHR